MTAQRAVYTTTDETIVSFESYLALEAHSEAQFEYYYVKHYLIVDQEEPLVEMYSRRNGDRVYEYFEGLEAVVPIEHFEAQLPLATIYKKINFASSRSDS